MTLIWQTAIKDTVKCALGSFVGIVGEEYMSTIDAHEG